MNRMNRRKLLALLASCLASTRLAFAERRQGLPKLGILWAADAATAVPYLAAFTDGLRDLGWVEGNSIQTIVRYDDGVAARRSDIATGVVASGVDVLFVFDPIVPAARKVAGTIPIVCGDFFDPIAEGFTRSMARPDGNITGVSWQSIDTAGKRVQLVRELKPRAKRIGFVYDTGDGG